MAATEAVAAAAVDAATSGGVVAASDAAATASSTSVAPIFPGLDLPLPESLRLILGMMSPTEVGRAELVCRSWRRGVRESSDLWRAVAISASSSEAVVEILAAGVRARYRDIAIGLVAPPPAPQVPAQLPEPQLRIEDLMLLVQVRRRVGGGDDDGDGKVVAACVISDLSGLFSENNEVELPLDGKANSGAAPFFFEGKNPMGAGNTARAGRNGDPIQEAACTGTEDLLVSCRLFRMDGNRCQQVCLMGTGDANDGWGAGEWGDVFLPDPIQRRFTAIFWEQGELESNLIPRLASGTAQAAIARQMMSIRQYDRAYFGVDVEFSSLLAGTPPPDAGWAQTLRGHQELRWRERDDAIAWSDQDREELARIDRFDFQATKLVVKFTADTEHAGIPRDLSVNDKRLLFEGFDWK